MNWKEIYTKIFLKQSNKSVSEATIKEYMPVWWQNTRVKDAGGLRLTREGYSFIVDELDLEVYDIPYPPNFELTPQTVIFLDQFITCPYYLDVRSIKVTDEKKAVELTLFSGDVRKYGLMKAMKRQGKS